MNGRKVWDRMPHGNWFIEDDGGSRCICVAPGIGDRQFGAFYRDGGVYGRVMSSGRHRVRSGKLPMVGTMEEARRMLWDWVKGQQVPMMRIKQGYLPEGHCCPKEVVSLRGKKERS